MKGVRLYRQRFVDAFGCLLPELDALTVYGVSFRIPDALSSDDAQDDECCVELRALSLDGVLDFDEGFFSPGFFRKYAAGILNDWNEIYLFDHVDLNRDELRRKLERQGSAAYLERHRLARAAVAAVDPIAMFQNWDGAYWQMFSTREDWGNRVIAVAKDRGADWQLVDFSIEFPDPSEIAIRHALADHERLSNPKVDSPTPASTRHERKTAWL
jgi:hypothetical protein